MFLDYCPLSTMALWQTLYQTWIPSSSMLVAMRELLRDNTTIDHSIPGRNVPIVVVMHNVEASILPEQEKARFAKLLAEGVPHARIHRLFDNWAMCEENVEETRMSSEKHFTILELRIDRLERIIREENFINGRLAVRMLKNTEAEYNSSSGSDIPDDYETEDSNGSGSINS
jgi:hypothetical protein